MLKVAECKREALFADDAQRAPVRFHSLRDTRLTFMAIRGDEPLRIQWRAGHTAYAMTEKYIAQARRFEAWLRRGVRAAPARTQAVHFPVHAGGEIGSNLPKSFSDPNGN